MYRQLGSGSDVSQWITPMKKDWASERTTAILSEDGPNFSPAFGRACHNSTIHTRPHTVPSSEAERDLAMFESIFESALLSSVISSQQGQALPNRPSKWK